MTLGWVRPYTKTQAEFVAEIKRCASAFNEAEQQWIDAGLNRLMLEPSVCQARSVSTRLRFDSSMDALTEARWHQMRAAELELDHIIQLAELMGGSM